MCAIGGCVLCRGCIRTDNIDLISVCWVCPVWSMASLCVPGVVLDGHACPSVNDVSNPPGQPVLLKP